MAAGGNSPTVSLSVAEVRLRPGPTLKCRQIAGPTRRTGGPEHRECGRAQIPGNLTPGVANRLGLEARGPMSRPLDHLAEGNRAAHARWGGLVIAVLRPLTLESTPEGVGHDELAEGRRHLDGLGVGVFPVRTPEEIHAIVMSDGVGDVVGVPGELPVEVLFAAHGDEARIDGLNPSVV